MKIDFSDLIQQKLVKETVYPNGLRIVKYAKKVFYDNLWHKDERLLDARGMVLDAEGNVVVWPFTKIFNHGENGTTLPDDQKVVWVEKVNGFMGCVTNTEKFGTIYSTTGSLDSDFVQLIKKHVRVQLRPTIPDYTYIFEIVDKTDPHIVDHEPGAYLIGARHIPTGTMVRENMLDATAEMWGWKRPRWDYAKFAEVVEMSKTVKHEGFVVREALSGNLLLKIKSPHYLSKKFIMRMGEGKVRTMWDSPQAYKQIIDEEFYEIVDWLVKTYNVETWLAMDDQARREVIEAYFEE